MAPTSSRFYVHPPGISKQFRLLPGSVPGVDGVSRFTINSLGLRGRELNPNRDQEYRILAIGGSATECVYLDDTEAWPFQVQEVLRRTSDGRSVWVGNAGKSGANSRDHVLHVKYLLAQYPGIDAVLLMAGVNDLGVRLAQADHYAPPPPLTSPAAEARQLRRAFAKVLGSARDSTASGDAANSIAWYRKTEVYNLLRMTRYALASLLTPVGPSHIQGGREYVQLRAKRQAAVSILDGLPDLTTALQEYARNLNTIVDIAQAHGSRIVLMTQPVLWRDRLKPEAEGLLWFGGTGDFIHGSAEAYYSSRALSKAMGLYNEELLRICAVRRVECIDLAGRVPQTLVNFYDDVHFTEKGARLVARIVSKHFLRREPFVARKTGGRHG